MRAVSLKVAGWSSRADAPKLFGLPLGDDRPVVVEKDLVRVPGFQGGLTGVLPHGQMIGNKAVPRRRARARSAISAG